MNLMGKTPEPASSADTSRALLLAEEALVLCDQQGLWSAATDLCSAIEKLKREVDLAEEPKIVG